MPRSVTLNADLGEGFGPWRMGDDDALLGIVGAANLACGAHAGDPLIMRRLAARAAALGVGLGAHPGFDDRQGFGRRRVEITPEEAAALLAYQVGALRGVAATVGARVGHVKPHGALYTMAAEDAALAGALAGAVHAIDPRLILVGPDRSALARAAADLGLPFAAEGFADRAYLPDGRLAPRSAAGAVIHDPAECARRAVRMVRDQAVDTLGGGRLPLRVDTVCLHGDTPGALAVARAVREALETEGLRLTPLSGLDLLPLGGVGLDVGRMRPPSV